MDRISAATYRQRLLDERAAKSRGMKFGHKRSTSKFGNVKVVDPASGHTFDSKAEYTFYTQLKLRERAGEVADIELQPKYWLTEARGRAGTCYKADFRYRDLKTGLVHVVDVKGAETRTFKDKMKQMRERHPDVTVEIIKKARK